jgi:putative ABC transport system permease protein
MTINSFYESLGFLADSTYFRMFTYHFKEGSGQNALNEPILLFYRKKQQRKFSGKEPALNKIVHINSNTNGSNDFRVTGVFVPSTTPSHINAKFFISMNSGVMVDWLKNMTNMVNNNMFYSYLLLKPGSDPKKLEKKFEAFIEKHAGADLKASGRTRKQILTLVPDIHLYANTEGNVTPDGSLMYLKILFSIALITLLIACVNFMNLSTARSSKRAIEIGVRKVMGAEKNSLIGQFITEAIFFSILAFIVRNSACVILNAIIQTGVGKRTRILKPAVYRSVFSLPGDCGDYRNHCRTISSFLSFCL